MGMAPLAGSSPKRGTASQGRSPSQRTQHAPELLVKLWQPFGPVRGGPRVEQVPFYDLPATLSSARLRLDGELHAR
jgi:hypothetical protein